MSEIIRIDENTSQSIFQQFDTSRQSRQLFPDANIILPEEQDDLAIQVLVELINGNSNEVLEERINQIFTDIRFSKFLLARENEEDVLSDSIARELADQYGYGWFSLAEMTNSFLTSFSSPQSSQ